MPRKNGELTPREKLFTRTLARTNDKVYSAYVAGYAAPETNGFTLANRQALRDATREEMRRFLYDKAGSIGVQVLVAIAIDEKQPAGARRGCAMDLAKLSGIAVTDVESRKDMAEMTGQELALYRAKLEAQRQALDHALADRAKPILENQDIFG